MMVKKNDLTKDIQGVMLNEYGCIAKDIIPTLSCDMALRKKLVEFLSKYMAQIAETNSEAYFAFDNDEEIEKVIKRLKSSCVECNFRKTYRLYSKNLPRKHFAHLGCKYHTHGMLFSLHKSVLLLQG